MSISFSTIQQKARAQPISATSKKMMEYVYRIPPTHVTRTAAQVRVAAEENPMEKRFATVGLWLEVGSKTEAPHQQGITKTLLTSGLLGTASMDRKAISRTVEELGGKLIVDVGREHSYVAFKGLQPKNIPKAVAFLNDVVCNARLDDESVAEAKKSVETTRQNADELIDEQTMDLLHICAYDATENGGLGNSVFGTQEGIASLTSYDLRNFRQKHITGPRMMLVGTGGVNHTELEKLAESNFGSVSQENNKEHTRTRFVGGDIRHHQPRMKTGHIAWAVETCGHLSGDTVALQLFSHFHGGWDRYQGELGLMPVHRMMTIYGAHDHGPTHYHLLAREAMESLKTFHLAYEDTGLTGSYLVGRPYKSCYKQAIAFADMLEIQIREITRLVAKAIHDQELAQAKANYKSQLLMNMDGATNSAIDAAEQIFHLGRRVPLSEMYNRIDDITATNVQEVMNHYYTARNPVFALNGNFNPIPGYDCMARWTNHPLWHMSL